MIQMSDNKALQNRIVSRILKEYGYLDYSSTIQDEVEALEPMRRPEMTDNDFEQYCVDMIGRTYDEKVFDYGTKSYRDYKY